MLLCYMAVALFGSSQHGGQNSNMLQVLHGDVTGRQAKYNIMMKLVKFIHG